MGSMCFSSIAIVMGKDNTELLGEAVLTQGVMLSILFCYCWSGEQLRQKADAVALAAWETEWVGAPIAFQRSMLFVISAASKEIIFTAGKFVSVSNVTLVKILQQTLSLITFLLSLSE
ncbi:hypothetical protein C0J52_08215 [Blattella germanica]|nr:hypothetical protein C0J52_08215 [Blattella germanica]